MPQYQQWAVLIGSLMPALVAVVQHHVFPSWLRALIAAGSSGAAAVITIYVQKGSLDLSATHWTETVMLVIASAELTYRLYWKPTGIAPGIEKKTTPLIAASPTPPKR